MAEDSEVKSRGYASTFPLVIVSLFTAIWNVILEVSLTIQLTNERQQGPLIDPDFGKHKLLFFRLLVTILPWKL